MKTKKRTASLRVILLVIITSTLLLAQFLAIAFDVTTPIQGMELGARDLMMRTRGPRPTSGEVVIVAIDDTSLAWKGIQWPWPRAYLAEIVDKINAAGARAVGVDIFLFKAGADAPLGDEALARALEEAQDSVNVIQIFRDPLQPGSVTVNLPFPILRESLDGMGITALVHDKDAISRSAQAYDFYSGQTYFNWAFEIARLYLDADAPVRVSSTQLNFNGQSVPLQRGNLLINFAGPAGTFPTYSVAQLMEGDVLEKNPDALRGKIVLLGATTITLQDLYPTPFSTQTLTPGVEIVANTVDMMIHGNYLRESPPWIALAMVLAAALLAAFITRSQNPSVTIILLAAGMGLYALACHLVFVYRQMYLPLVGPEVMLFLGVIVPTIEQAVSQEMEKRRVRGLFTRFISPEMVDQLIATQDINSLNKRANLTILFSDIRGFTTLSEKLAPEEVVALLNPYLEAMTDVIYQHGGTVDKYEGDAIIAFFGEPVSYPDHALRCVRAAVDMRKALDQLKARWEKEGTPRPNLEMGIGIHSGPVFVGLLGSAQRINYTVIGDTANLAARLQDLTKTYVWPILISESTYLQVKEEFNAEFVDSVLVKGKSEPVNTYKLLGRKGSDTDQVQAWKLPQR
jgi:adenylate cyclase